MGILKLKMKIQIAFLFFLQTSANVINERSQDLKIQDHKIQSSQDPKTQELQIQDRQIQDSKIQISQEPKERNRRFYGLPNLIRYEQKKSLLLPRSFKTRIVSSFLYTYTQILITSFQ